MLAAATAAEAVRGRARALTIASIFQYFFMIFTFFKGRATLPAILYRRVTTRRDMTKAKKQQRAEVGPAEPGLRGIAVFQLTNPTVDSRGALRVNDAAAVAWHTGLVDGVHAQ